MRLKEQQALFGGSWLEEPAAAAVAAVRMQFQKNHAETSTWGAIAAAAAAASAAFLVYLHIGQSDTTLNPL
jgi:hypothetical protein